ncbi:MAG: DUF2892 domain-containing protein [Anaerolineales bacterium]|nr:DUF2892 domain-containing protein [Anaerolineales bacterium]
MKNNIGMLDRFIRAILGPILIALGLFWVAGALQVILILLGVIFSTTALMGFCPLYLPFNLSTNKSETKLSGKSAIALPITLILALVAASLASVYITRKQFLENYNAMNSNYKQALFQTGQKNREEANKYYEQLQITYADFSSMYATYRPYALWNDAQFSADLAKVDGIIKDAAPLVKDGDLTAAHVQLEQARPIFQEMFKRNGFSLLAMNLVDFHDVMEKLIDDSAKKDSAAVIEHYAEADRLLKAVETDLNDADVQSIRQSLDTLLKTAQDGKVDDLAAQAAALKSGFLKVYLIRG